MKFGPSDRKRALVFVLTCALSWSSYAGVATELILDVAIEGQPRVANIVFETTRGLFIPASDAAALGLPRAESMVVEDISVPVIKGIEVRREEDVLYVTAPVTYFENHQVKLASEEAAVDLPALPAAWLQYDFHIQSLENARALGGLVSANVSHKGWNVRSEFRANQELSLPPLTRVATTAETTFAGATVSLGDITSSARIPVITNRGALGVRVGSEGIKGPASRPLTLQGAVEKAGNILVRANGATLASYTMAPGTFEVLDLPRLTGDARYEVLFDDGKTVKLLGGLDASNTQGLLDAGQFTYSTAVGLAQSEQSRLRGAPVYTRNLMVDGTVQYGLTKDVNLTGSVYQEPNETWLGGALMSNLSLKLSMELGAYAVVGERSDGVMTQAAMTYRDERFTVLASDTRFSSGLGTPKDGLISESKVSLNFGRVSAYLLNNTAYSFQGPLQFRTVGLSATHMMGPLSLSVFAARINRQEGSEFSLGLYASLALDRYAQAYLNTRRERTAVGARYTRPDEWTLNAETSSGQAGQNYIASGAYDTRVGTLYGTVAQSAGAAAQPIIGVQGAVALAASPKGIVWSAYKGSSGDSVLAIDAGAPQAEVVLDHNRRLIADDQGMVLAPLSSAYAHTLAMDVATLDPNLTTLDDKKRVRVKPRSVGHYRYDVRSVGFSIQLVDSNGAGLPEGSIVTWEGNRTLVGRDGVAWLDTTADALMVQIGVKKFCKVKTAIKEEGVYTCVLE